VKLQGRRANGRRPLFAAVVVSSLLAAPPGCDREAKPAFATATSKPTPTSASVYGDPALFPSREGGQALRELALAGDARQLLLALAPVRDATVVVRVPRPTAASAAVWASSAAKNDREPVRVSAVLTLTETARVDAQAETELRQRVDSILRSSVAPQLDLNLQLRRTERVGPSPDRAPPRGGRALDIGFALALLGFGLSAGLVLERLRQRGSLRWPPQRK